MAKKTEAKDIAVEETEIENEELIDIEEFLKSSDDEEVEFKSLDDLAEEEPQDLSEEAEALREENAALKDRLMRALADAENSRKRGERDRREAEIYGGRKLARDLLPVYDNFKRALETITDEQRQANKGLIEGIEITQRELLSVFGNHQITVINPEAGEKFDPEIHQAMFEAPVPGTKKGEIIQVMSEGFMIADRLLRAAQVGVSAGSPG